MILKYLDEIEKALRGKLYIIALSSALALPDICACLELDDPSTTGNVKKRYEEWYNEYAEKHCYLNADLCYKYRCSMIHSNRSKINANCEKVAFFLPPVNCIFNACTFDIKYLDEQGKELIERAITIDYETFINGMIKAVKEWRTVAVNTANYQKNIKELLQIRPLSPLNMISGDLVAY